ncbi:MAG TPA: transcription antitermination factor NusB [Candidatus Babeliales bacterium]|nr:transcription antitermination factor NusB [Candidatus Babeliales bacterium]
MLNAATEGSTNMCSEQCTNHNDTAELAQISYADLSQRDVRSLVFHLLYAMDAYEYADSLNAIADRFSRGFKIDIPVDCSAMKIAQEVITQRDELDEKIKPFLHNWRFERIGLCTKLILRLALWELDQKDVVPSVVINEAIELAKCFAEKDAYKFINGILDEAVKAKEEK